MRIIKTLKVELEEDETAETLAETCNDLKGACAVTYVEDCPFRGVHCREVSPKHWREAIKGKTTETDTVERYDDDE